MGNLYFFPNKEQMKTQMICSLKIATIGVTYNYWAGMVQIFKMNLFRLKFHRETDQFL